MAILKFIADVNIEKNIIDLLRKKKFDVKWIPEYDCAITDEQIIKLANKEKRILVTNDKDFGELVFLQHQSTYGLILFRIKGQDSKEKIKMLSRVLTEFEDRIVGHFIVISKEKIRFIPMEMIK